MLARPSPSAYTLALLRHILPSTSIASKPFVVRSGARPAPGPRARLRPGTGRQARGGAAAQPPPGARSRATLCAGGAARPPTTDVREEELDHSGDTVA